MVSGLSTFNISVDKYDKTHFQYPLKKLATYTMTYSDLCLSTRNKARETFIFGGGGCKTLQHKFFPNKKCLGSMAELLTGFL